jgi:hypothetical protein
MVHPWPSEREPYAVEKSTILLSLGCIPVTSVPPYAAEAAMMNNEVNKAQNFLSYHQGVKVLQTLCIESEIHTKPSGDQMQAVNERLENRCWRCIPSLYKTDIVGAREGVANDKIIEERFAALTKKMDDLLNNEQNENEAGSSSAAAAASAVPVDTILKALPRIFTENADIWPKRRMVKMLLYVNSLQSFTESLPLMAMVSKK